jgi:glycerol-3-phosphate acyltransferase PlsY
MEAPAFFGIPLLAYLLGAIPFGVVWTRLFAAADVRRSGSGNIGATNVARVAGLRLGLATLVCDFLKGFGPAWLAGSLAPASGIPGDFLAAAAALSAFGGHLYPVYTRFRGGGKGVATAAGGFTALAPSAALAAALVFLLVFAVGRRVSAASLAGAAVLPFAVYAAGGSAAAALGALICAAFIFGRHRENIRRLVRGTEPVFTLRGRRPPPG